MKKILLLFPMIATLCSCNVDKYPKHIKTTAELIIEIEEKDGYYIRTDVEYLDDHYIWLIIDTDTLGSHKEKDELVMTYYKSKYNGCGYYFDYWLVG